MGFDPLAAPGSKFTSSAVRAEIAELAPSTLDPGSVTESKIANGAVSNGKLANGAVNSAKIAVSGVGTTNLADGAVTADKAGTGVMTAHNGSGTAISADTVYLTAAEYAQIGTPDPDVFYFIH